jgi:hypothetical protein
MTVFGVSVWWPVGAGFAVLFAGLLVGVAADRTMSIRRRDVNDKWPRDLADGGPLDQQQRDDLLAGEVVPADPAVVRSVRRYRRRRGGAR